MLQKLNNLRLPIGFAEADIIREINKKIGGYKYVKIDKLSLDSRRKNDIHYTANIVISGKPNSSKLVEYLPKKSSVMELVESGVKSDSRPIIIGSGPCGMFAGLLLASQGLKPIIFERGERVDKRAKTVDNFDRGAELLEESNIQYGEGGAGTFSDGKLNTGINSEYINIVLSEFVRMGADPSILYDSKPHIGTDVLRNVVKNIREEIEKLGGEYHFDSKVSDIKVRDGKVVAVKVNDIDFEAENIILACGHSARDTVKMLYDKGVDMEAKAFAVGMRVEHTQEMLDIAQYGRVDRELPPSDYKLSHRLDNGKGCFTFCMCPGGYVVPAESETHTVVTNGMSERARDGKFCNSAVLVGVDPIDYGNGALDGFEFQRNLEKMAYMVGDNYSAPAVLVKDFLKGNISRKVESFENTYSRGLVTADIDKILPSFVTNGMREGLVAFGRKVRGFDSSGVLIGVESRSSSPVRICRDENGESNIKGLYPAGEGAGYAGGITSSAVDGIKVALKLINKLKEN